MLGEAALGRGAGMGTLNVIGLGTGTLGEATGLGTGMLGEATLGL